MWLIESGLQAIEVTKWRSGAQRKEGRKERAGVEGGSGSAMLRKHSRV